VSKHYFDLFDALALASLPLQRVLDLARDMVLVDDGISDKYREELKNSIKVILSHSLELHDYLEKKGSNFDFRSDGKNRYIKLREEFKEAFPSTMDKSYNLYELILNESDRRFLETRKNKEAKD
jgi:hypothetical protein